ncbi:MAG: type II toxin-antitoxin system VapC family toxin [Sulfurovum sp.]|nr:type II toxin-antitoxin system VapC family toxin [Sulfurovum sp.]
MKHKDDSALSFYFSGDFITTFYYVLSERRKIDKQKVVTAIDALCFEIEPFYINHNDFLEAKDAFVNHKLDDFEDLLILHSAVRCGCDSFLTSDIEILALKSFETMQIEGV